MFTDTADFQEFWSTAPTPIGAVAFKRLTPSCRMVELSIAALTSAIRYYLELVKLSTWELNLLYGPPNPIVSILTCRISNISNVKPNQVTINAARCFSENAARRGIIRVERGQGNSS